jgi:hypothetical protein
MCYEEMVYGLLINAFSFHYFVSLMAAHFWALNRNVGIGSELAREEQSSWCNLQSAASASMEGLKHRQEKLSDCNHEQSFAWRA